MLRDVNKHCGKAMKYDCICKQRRLGSPGFKRVKWCLDHRISQSSGHGELPCEFLGRVGIWCPGFPKTAYTQSHAWWYIRGMRKCSQGHVDGNIGNVGFVFRMERSQGCGGGDMIGKTDENYEEEEDSQPQEGSVPSQIHRSTSLPPSISNHFFPWQSPQS